MRFSLQVDRHGRSKTTSFKQINISLLDHATQAVEVEGIDVVNDNVLNRWQRKKGYVQQKDNAGGWMVVFLHQKNNHAEPTMTLESGFQISTHCDWHPIDVWVVDKLWIGGQAQNQDQWLNEKTFVVGKGEKSQV